MINLKLLKEEIIKAEQGDTTARAVVVEVLRPQATDSVEEISKKQLLFIRLFFLASLNFKDASFHRDIDKFYAEQIHSYLNNGTPRYKGALIVGYRESAKTTRVKFNECYLACYLPEYVDYTLLVSDDGNASNQFNMDLFNMLGFSKIKQYFPNLISVTQEKKKESQTMAKFTTTTGVTYSASSARKSKRGSNQADVSDDGEVEVKRPTKIIADDIENESTLLSLASTEQINAVLSATIDGLDHQKGFWIIIGNYLSLRGNVAKYLNKYRDDDSVFILQIPIKDGVGTPTWSDKYSATDKEASETGKVSIEKIERDSDNFETEYMNNPKRNMAYFDIVPDELDLISDTARDNEGVLVLEEAVSKETYILSADSATGQGKDDSAFVVSKVSGQRFQEVANFKSNRIRPEQFAGIIAQYARRYNDALVIPENNYPGNEVIAFLRPIYHRIYKLDDDYGVSTNLKSKPEMLLNAKRIFKDKLYICRSRSLYSQILEYPASEVRTVSSRDDRGGHFDLLMALVVGLYKADAISIDNSDIATDNLLRKTIDGIFQEDSHSW